MADELVSARVVKLDRGYPLVELDNGVELRCKHATALVKGKETRAVIGDRVMVNVPPDADKAQIVQVLPRTSSLVRRDPSERTLPQTLAANFDTVIVAHPLAELNVRRLERELVLAHETGAAVVVALTKADLASAERAHEAFAHVRAMCAQGVAVLQVSEADPESIEELRALVPKGSVAVLIGRSGVGKSSLVNMLAGAQVQETTPVRASDGKGRHTTVSRSMIALPGGGMIVDMPGVRGLGLWESERGLQAAFPDIVQLSEHCRFRDCAHENEPGCAVQEALRSGSLAPERLESYQHLVRENEEVREAEEQAQRQRERRGHPRRRKG